MLEKAFLSQFVTLVAGGTIMWLWNRLKSVKKAKDEADERTHAIGLGVQALLRDRLMQGYTFFMKRGYILVHEKESYMNCFEQYEKLGSNGVVEDLVMQIKRLPNIEKVD